ncbi:uncharacterized protein LOC134290376 [Aedes albopictus]|uniref:Uncharacterized protein n=1 Tax=Aedes albopictus TaxID=7160 RepID=A0ABM1YSA0_AEDAL
MLFARLRDRTLNFVKVCSVSIFLKHVDNSEIRFFQLPVIWHYCTFFRTDSKKRNCCTPSHRSISSSNVSLHLGQVTFPVSSGKPLNGICPAEVVQDTAQNLNEGSIPQPVANRPADRFDHHPTLIDSRLKKLHCLHSATTNNNDAILLPGQVSFPVSSGPIPQPFVIRRLDHFDDHFTVDGTLHMKRSRRQSTTNNNDALLLPGQTTFPVSSGKPLNGICPAEVVEDTAPSLNESPLFQCNNTNTNFNHGETSCNGASSGGYHSVALPASSGKFNSGICPAEAGKDTAPYLSLSKDDLALVFGDYNQSKLVWNLSSNEPPSIDVIRSSISASCSALLDGFSLHGLVQINQVLNRNNRLLDLLLVNESALSECSIGETTEPLITLDADHPALEVCVNLSIPL